jgi:hypothetical protein
MIAAPTGFPSAWWNIALALYAMGWLALFIAPLRHRFCWILARSCAVMLALLSVTLNMVSYWPIDLFSMALGGHIAQAIATLLPMLLFIGSWQVEDSPQHGIPHRILLPVLLLTAATGPLGFIAHIGLRDIMKIRNARVKRYDLPP